MENVTDTSKPAPEASLYEKNKLRIAGILNGIGDVSLLWGAWTSKDGKDPFKIAAGLLYTLGAATIALFGSSSKESQVKDLTERAAEFVQSQSTEKSADLESARVVQQRDMGVLANMSRTLRRYSAQIMLWFYTFGAGALLVSGVQKYNADKAKGDKPEIGKILVGGTSLIVKTASLLMPEKSTVESENANSPKKGTLAWFKEKPMRFFGYGSLATDGFWAYKTYESFSRGEDWKWDALTTSSYITSDFIMAGTNKDAANAVGKMSQAEQTKLENMMAETISVQPEAQREKLSTEVAEFLKKESIVNGSAEQLRESILQRATKLWSERHQEAPTLETQRA